MTAIEDDSAESGLLRKAVNLFTFLGRTQQLLVKPVRTADKYEKLLWFGQLPDHTAVRSAHRVTSPDPEAPILAVDRIARIDPPAPPELLGQWLVGGVDDVDEEPALREAIFIEQPVEAGDGSDGESDVHLHRIELSDQPEVTTVFEGWLGDWHLWADRERGDAVVRDVYKQLFATHLTSVDHSEEFELVLGVGCLSWRPDDH